MGWIINSKHLFFSLVGCKVQGHSAGRSWVWREPASSLMAIFSLSSHGGRGDGALWGLFHKNTNLTQEASILTTQASPKGPVSYTITLGITFNTGFWERTHSVNSRIEENFVDLSLILFNCKSLLFCVHISLIQFVAPSLIHFDIFFVSFFV